MSAYRPPDLTPAEREAVAAILALDDGPHFVPGATGAQWEADMAFAVEMDRRLRERPNRASKPRRPGGGECKQV